MTVAPIHAAEPDAPQRTPAASAPAAASAPTRPMPASPTSLVDLLDRLLATGVVLAGDVTISLAGVDLVTVRLQALVSAVRPGVDP